MDRYMAEIELLNLCARIRKEHGIAWLKRLLHQELAKVEKRPNPMETAE